MLCHPSSLLLYERHCYSGLRAKLDGFAPLCFRMTVLLRGWNIERERYCWCRRISSTIHMGACSLNDKFSVPLPLSRETFPADRTVLHLPHCFFLIHPAQRSQSFYALCLDTLIVMHEIKYPETLRLRSHQS